MFVIHSSITCSHLLPPFQHPAPAPLLAPSPCSHPWKSFHSVSRFVSPGPSSFPSVWPLLSQRQSDPMAVTGRWVTGTLSVHAGQETGLKGIPSYLEHHVNCTSVGGDGHSAPFWGGLGGHQGDDGFRIRQRLNLQAVFLHQRHGGRVYALKVTCRETSPIRS